MANNESYSILHHWDPAYADYARSIRFPTSKEKRVNTTRFLWSLKGHVNPSTGKLYNEDDMASIMGYSRKAFNNALLEAGIVRSPSPEVRIDKLPENQRAFFEGLRHGSFESRELTWGSKKLVAITTASKDETRRHVLKTTLGSWGNIHESDRSLSIYLDPNNFGFIAEKPECTVPQDVENFAPFMLGVMSMKMSRKEGRISSQNGEMIDAMSNGYQNHFGDNLGYTFAEQRPDQLSPTHTIQLRNPQSVFANLLSVPSVQSLPFLGELLGRKDRPKA